MVMSCLTTKKKFDAVNPEVVVLSNGRHAYRAQCPWKGKNDRTLYAYKFTNAAAHGRCLERKRKFPGNEEEEEDEHFNTPESGTGTKTTPPPTPKRKRVLSNGEMSAESGE